MVTKKTIDEFMPHIRDLFPGKPVTTTKGDAFIIKKESEGSYNIQYATGKDKEVVRFEEFKEEKDTNEITYDAKQLLEIETNKKERISEILKNRKTSTGRCTAMCTSFFAKNFSFE